MTNSHHITHLEQVFERIRLANHRLNLKNCELANAKLDFPGHSLSLNTVQQRQQKVDALLKFPAPNSRKQVQLLLGALLPHFADLTMPLTKLLKRNVPFKWST